MAADEEVGARLRLRDRREFSDDAQRAAKDVKNIGDEADKVDRKARNMAGGLGVASKGIGGLRSAATLGVTALAAVTVGVGALAVKTVGLAMDAGETASKFNTVFAGMEAQVGGFVKTMNADYGIPTKELQDAAATFGIFGKAADVPTDKLADFSTSLVSAGMDMASFYNQEPGDVFLALRSGLAGEAEPLRQFGIFLSDATMKAKAAQMGLTGELNESQKVMVRQALILENLGDAQGDMARTSGSLSNQWKGLKGRLIEGATAIGTMLLPTATTLVNYLNEKVQPAIAWLQGDGALAISAFGAAFREGDVTSNGWFGKVERAGEVMGIAYRGAQRLVGQLPNLAGAVRDLDSQGVGEVLDNMLGNTGQYVGPIRDGFQKIVDVGTDVMTIWRDGVAPAFDTVSSAMPGALEAVLHPLTAVDDVLSFLADHAKQLKPLVIGLVGAFTAYKTTVLVLTAVDKARQAVAWAGVVMDTKAAAATNAQRVAKLALAGVMKGITVAQWLLNAAMTANPIALVVLGIAALIAIFVLAWNHSDTFRNIVTGAFNKVKDVAMGAFNWVKSNWPLLLAILTGPIGLAVLAIVKNWDTIKSTFSAVKDWIARTASGMWDGIKHAFKSALNWVITAWNKLEFKIPGFKIGPVGYDGFTLGVPDIPRLHQGGTTKTGGAVNMKPGEEIVVLPPAATVVPIEGNVAELVAASGGGGGAPIVVQLVVDRKVLAEAVYDHTGDKVARR